MHSQLAICLLSFLHIYYLLDFIARTLMSTAGCEKSLTLSFSDVQMISDLKLESFYFYISDNDFCIIVITIFE